MSSGSAKQKVLEALEKLPADATLEDAIERLVLLAKIERGLIFAPTARPKRIACSTAPWFTTGSTPGKAMSTAEACVFGCAPKAVDAAEKILLRVRS